MALCPMQLQRAKEYREIRATDRPRKRRSAKMADAVAFRGHEWYRAALDTASRERRALSAALPGPRPRAAPRGQRAPAFAGAAGVQLGSFQRLHLDREYC